uniref:Secreted peptide n=1 Tax=Rhipicephalus pulchellus TaxID=72859 RepID=L7LVQ2_RHIPC
MLPAVAALSLLSSGVMKVVIRSAATREVGADEASTADALGCSLELDPAETRQSSRRQLWQHGRHRRLPSRIPRPLSCLAERLTRRNLEALISFSYSGRENDTSPNAVEQLNKRKERRDTTTRNTRARGNARENQTARC